MSVVRVTTDEAWTDAVQEAYDACTTAAGDHDVRPVQADHSCRDHEGVCFVWTVWAHADDAGSLSVYAEIHDARTY